MEWARPGIRVLAAMIDLIAAFLSATLVLLVCNALLSAFADHAVQSTLLMTVWLAYAALDVYPGRTPGKALLQLRIMRRGQQPPGPARLALRLALKLTPLLLISPVSIAHGLPDVLIVPCILLVLGMLLPVLVGDGRALYDLAAGTVVVSVRDEPESKRAFAPVMPGEDASTH